MSTYTQSTDNKNSRYSKTAEVDREFTGKTFFGLKTFIISYSILNYFFCINKLLILEKYIVLVLLP